jgi:hypothetical protein
MWQDEAQNFCIDQDAVFQTTARSKGIAVVRLVQGLPNFLDAYGPNGKHKVYMLLGNHNTKVFHRNGDSETNEWASKVIAKDTRYRPSLSASGDFAKGISGSASLTEIEEESCPAKEFIALRNGGAEHDFEVEGILFQSGRIWNGTDRWCVRIFKQQ